MERIYVASLVVACAIECTRCHWETVRRTGILWAVFVHSIRQGDKDDRSMESCSRTSVDKIARKAWSLEERTKGAETIGKACIHNGASEQQRRGQGKRIEREAA